MMSRPLPAVQSPCAAVKQSGVLLMPCIEILSFATSCFTCHLLVLISKSSGETSFSQLGERFLGRAALVVPCLIVMNNLGVMIAFLEVSSPCAQWWAAHTVARQ